LKTILAKLPIGEIKTTIQASYSANREAVTGTNGLERVVEDMVLGILGGETPVITEMARQNSKRGWRELGSGQADLSIIGKRAY